MVQAEAGSLKSAKLHKEAPPYCGASGCKVFEKREAPPQRLSIRIHDKSVVAPRFNIFFFLLALRLVSSPHRKSPFLTNYHIDLSISHESGSPLDSPSFKDACPQRHMQGFPAIAITAPDNPGKRHWPVNSAGTVPTPVWKIRMCAASPTRIRVASSPSFRMVRCSMKSSAARRFFPTSRASWIPTAVWDVSFSPVPSNSE